MRGTPKEPAATAASAAAKTGGKKKPAPKKKSADGARPTAAQDKGKEGETPKRMLKKRTAKPKSPVP